MKCTLKGTFSFPSTDMKDMHDSSLKFLHKTFYYNEYEISVDDSEAALEGEILYIELRNIPYIFENMGKCLNFEHKRSLGQAIFEVDIHQFTEDGVLIYIASKEEGDGFIFIPFSEIICFYRLNEGLINK